MDGAEIAWRAKDAVRTLADRARLSILGKFGPPLPPDAGWAAKVWEAPGLRVSSQPVGAAAGTHRPWVPRLIERADGIAQHRLSFFNLEDRDLGNPVRWNRDHEHGRDTPTGFSAGIDYRDFRVAGDCKLVWEPNRHHHLVVLARAYRATGERRYAEAIAEQLTSWLDQCPPGTGMNWRSPLELGIRLINWVWALDMIRESGVVEGDLARRLVVSAYQQVWEVQRKYSQASSANNHRIGEAAGVFVATSYFKTLPEAARWRDESHRILAEELQAQTYPDGCTREHAFGYHFFVAQFFLVCGIVARRTGKDFPPEYWRRLEGMFAFAAALSEAGGTPPMFGDADDGYVLDLGGADRAAELLAVGAAVFNRSDLAPDASATVESTFWLDCEPSAQPQRPRADLTSRAFEDAGYFLLQAPGPERLSVFIDCAELGYGPLAAHGHADALSLTVRAFGADVLVDPGTYDYFSHPEWRQYFKSTRAHNTVTVDGQDQSEMLGKFLWGRRARATRVAWEPSPTGGRFVGEHDGYTSLPRPAVHRRAVALDGPGREITVEDTISGEGQYRVGVHFHFGPECRLIGRDSHTLRFDVAGRGTLTLQTDTRLTLETASGSTDPIQGWFSPGYHRRVPIVTAAASGSSGPTTFVSRLTFSASR